MTFLRNTRRAFVFVIGIMSMIWGVQFEEVELRRQNSYRRSISGDDREHSRHSYDTRQTWVDSNRSLSPAIVTIDQSSDFTMMMKVGLSWLGLLSSLPSVSLAASPFSSNVVALTARNWRREVEDSPHAVFVNICRIG